MIFANDRGIHELTARFANVDEENPRIEFRVYTMEDPAA